MKRQKTVAGMFALVFAAAAAFISGAGAAVSGCGSGSSQADARDRATDASCNRFQMCGNIGAGQMYETLESCEVQVRGSWDKQWPPSQCEGKINESELEVCLAAIASTTCGNGLDELNTIFVKCPASKVCTGAAPAPDGGQG